MFCTCSKWEHVRTCSKSVTFEHLMCSDVFCMNVFYMCSKWEHVRTCSKSVTFEHLAVFCTNVFCMCSKLEHIRTCSKSVTFEHLGVFCMCSKWEHIRTCSKSIYIRGSDGSTSTNRRNYTLDFLGRKRIAWHYSVCVIYITR